jgi:hypothetical protein
MQQGLTGAHDVISQETGSFFHIARPADCQQFAMLAIRRFLAVR